MTSMTRDFEDRVYECDNVNRRAMSELNMRSGNGKHTKGSNIER
jgi:hypothetical protein